MNQSVIQSVPGLTASVTQLDQRHLAAAGDHFDLQVITQLGQPTLALDLGQLRVDPQRLQVGRLPDTLVSQQDDLQHVVVTGSAGGAAVAEVSVPLGRSERGGIA